MKRPSAAEIGPLLRKIAAETRSGLEGAARIQAWPAAGTLPADVTALYTAAADLAAEGLGAPLTDDAAYAAAGRRMMARAQAPAGHRQGDRGSRRARRGRDARPDSETVDLAVTGGRATTAGSSIPGAALDPGAGWPATR